MKTPVHWPSLDWSQSNHALAALTGRREPTISYHRKRHAPDTCRKVIAWDTITDWSQSNDEIAAILGCTFKNVSCHRWEMGIAPGRRKEGSGRWPRKKPVATADNL